jgi:nucleotide-binding universal stress UspA family protein
MYRKIVVAYDGTGPGEAALYQGADLARQCQAELHLVGVIVSSGGLLLDPAIVPMDLIDAERQVLQAAMIDCVRDLGHRGVTALTAIRDGEPAREIIAYIQDIAADLVVVGHSHKGILARWFEGSVGTRLLDAMPCSVLVAIAGEQPADAA